MKHHHFTFAIVHITSGMCFPLMQIPLVGRIIELPLVSSLLRGFVPSAILLLFLAILPYLLRSLIRFGRVTSLGSLDTELLQKYHLFQFFAVFVFSFISGTAFSQLQQLIDNPKAIVSLLGIAAPQQATFFMTYLLLQALVQSPLRLLALPQLGMYLLRAPLAATPREKRRLWAEQVGTDAVVVLSLCTA